MKYLYLFVVVVHGLIHLMGFAKAFGLASLEELRTPISQPMGLLWLVAALLFLASAALLLAAPKWWWTPALVAVVLSQGVIITAWNDARFGTLANLIVVVPALVAALGHAPWSDRMQYEREAAAGLASASAPATVVREADLAHLPSAVQHYLRFAGVVGQPRVANYQLRFRGALRNGPDSAWMPMEAEQHSFVEPAERLFLVDARMFGLPTTAYHRYVGDRATFAVHVASLLKVVDARGPEMNRSETVTLFNDMCLLAPTTLLDERIGWEELGPQTVRASFTNAGNTISAVLTFDETGALTNFVSDDRSRTLDGKTYEHVRWSTPVTGWRSVDGHALPDAEAHWRLPTGEFAYGRFEVLDVAYNVVAH